MRLYYADPGLMDDLGHHANSCRFIVGELRARGIDTRVLAFVQVDRSIQAELSAMPHFRAYTYWLTDGDPICGWLNAYHDVAQKTRDDLYRLTDIGSDDVLYFNSGQAAQLFALAQWLATVPLPEVPHVVIELGLDPGLEVQISPDGVSISTRDPRIDARAVLLRHAARQLPTVADRRFHITTFEPNSSAAYRGLLGKRVGVLPLPRGAVTQIRSRAGRRPITVAVLGHQRPEKGYQFMPEVFSRLLDARADVRVLAHNGAPEEMRETQQALRALAATEPRITIDERQAGERTWAGLLDATDLILCPYDPGKFAVSYSAVAAEAVANGIPLVVPKGSSMARLMSEFGGAGTMFDRAESPAILEATNRALDRFDLVAALADAGASKWRQINGPSKFVDALLSLTGTRTECSDIACPHQTPV